MQYNNRDVLAKKHLNKQQTDSSEWSWNEHDE